jgi:hypothetical protein
MKMPDVALIVATQLSFAVTVKNDYSEMSEKRNRAGDEIIFVITKFRYIETH